MGPAYDEATTASASEDPRSLVDPCDLTSPGVQITIWSAVRPRRSEDFAARDVIPRKAHSASATCGGQGIVASRSHWFKR